MIKKKFIEILTDSLCQHTWRLHFEGLFPNVYLTGQLCAVTKDTKKRL